MLKAMALPVIWCAIAFVLAQGARPPGGLTLVGLLHDDRALNRPHDVELQGDIAYVPGKGGTLALIDVSDPASPRLVSSLVDAEGLDDAETVLPMGDILLLGTRDFLSIDVSDPSRPAILKQISDRPRIDRINGMALRGDYVFAANKSGYVDVFDVSDPADPRLFDVLDTRERGGLISPHDIAAFGDRIIVVEASGDGPAKVRIYRVADPGSDTPLPPAEWELEGAVEGKNRQNFGGANRVALSGHYA
ncbi:MAG: LVIVD repeat-containing protein [Armatimonadota bacterium]